MVTDREEVQRAWAVLWPILLALAFLFAMLSFFPFRVRLAYDPDEGIELMKAALVARGHPLYESTWSDQPPMFTLMLAGWMGLFGLQVIPARVLTLLLSALLLWAAAELLRRVVSAPQAALGAVLIVLLPYYVRLSASVMAGLPAIALAMLSLLNLILWHQRGGRKWLVFSALALGISVYIKLFTAFLAPIFISGLLIDGYKRQAMSADWREAVQPVLVWGLAIAATGTLFLLTLVGPGYLDQLLLPHLAANLEGSMEARAAGFDLAYYLAPGRYLLFLALLGVVIAFWSRRWLLGYLVAWAGGAYLLLSFQTPVWYHHQLLVTVPAAMLAGVGTGELWRVGRRSTRGTRLSWADWALALLGAFGLPVVMWTRLPDVRPRFRSHAQAVSRRDEDFLEDNAILREMTRYASETRWVVTDLPIYAFRAGLLVPPELAVFTEKRLETGFLTEAQVLESIEAYQPEQVLLGRFEYDALQEYLARRYRSVAEKTGVRLYIREGVLPPQTDRVPSIGGTE